MLKKYIRGILRSELEEEELRLFNNTMTAENYWKQVYHNQLDYTEKIINKKDKEIEELKDLYEQEKNKNYKTLESEELKQEIEKLKKENEQLKNLSCTIVVDNDGKLDSLFNQKLKSENEKLIGDKEVLKVALEESKNYVAYLEKETKKLNEKLDGIKCVIKKQRLSALTYEKLKKTFILVERYLKES